MFLKTKPRKKQTETYMWNESALSKWHLRRSHTYSKTLMMFAGLIFGN